MAETIYRQNIISVTYDGVILDGFMDGGCIRITYRGGEIELTEGTDGGSVNLATMQGMEVEIDLRESSRSHEFLTNKYLWEANGGNGSTLVIYTGTGRVLACQDMYVGLPGQLTTGDKQQGSHTYRFLANNVNLY